MPDITSETPTGQITVQGMVFDVPQPYAEGSTLTAGEASALNQTLAENLRNNFASTVKAAIAEFRKVNELEDDDEVPVSELDKDELQTKFTAYAGEYEFGVRRAGGTRTPTDPVEREALRIAEERIKDQLRAKNIKITSVSRENMRTLCEALLEQKPDIREEAKRRVEMTAAIALEDLDLSVIQSDGSDNAEAGDAASDEAEAA